MQYLVLALDAKDGGAPVRRAETMAAHVERATTLKQAGELHIGGPILDDAGKQIGSAQFVEFASPEGIDRYVKDDPFTLQDVWKDVKVFKVELRECRCVAQMRVLLNSAPGGQSDIVDCLRPTLRP